MEYIQKWFRRLIVVFLFVPSLLLDIFLKLIIFGLYNGLGNSYEENTGFLSIMRKLWK